MALLAHEPGLSIRTLAGSVSASPTRAPFVWSTGLPPKDLIETRAMPLTDAPDHFTLRQRRASTKVLNARDQIVAEGLSVLDEELVILGALSERVLRGASARS